MGLIVKYKKWNHLLAFLVFPILMGNFIVFDVRHGLTITKGLLSLGKSSQFLLPFSAWIQNRMDKYSVDAAV